MSAGQSKDLITIGAFARLGGYCVDNVDPEMQLSAVRTIRDAFVNREAPPVSVCRGPKAGSAGMAD